MSELALMTVPAVIPILPAVHSLLVVLALCGSALLAALVGLRHRSTRRSLLRFCWRQKWGLLSLGIATWGGVAMCGWVMDGLRSAPPAQPTVSGNWSPRGDTSRRGSLADSPAPISGGIRWIGGTGDSFFASPAIVGKRVFAVGFRGDRGRLFCWDAENGRQLWTARPDGFRATFSSPVIAGETLLVGEGLHQTPNASVFCLDLRAGREGDVLWSFETNSHVECTPVVDEQRVYVAAGDDGVYCLARAAKIDDSRRVIWHASGDRYPDVETALAVHRGRVFVGLGEGGEALAVLDAADGRELSRLAMPYPVYGLPAIVDDRLYVGMGTGNYVDHDETRGRVACVDLTTLDVAWTFDTPGTVLGAVVCDGQEIIFGCADGRVIVLDERGTLLREWDSRAGIVAAPAVTDDMVYVVNEAGVLYGLDRRRLQPVWETRLGPPGQYVSSPIVAHGHVYVGTSRDGFVCAGAPADGAESATTGLPDRGEVLWTYPIDGRLLAAPGVTHSAIVVAVGSENGHHIVSLANRGSQPPVLSATLSTNLALPRWITTVNEIAIVATASQLLAIDALTTEVLWKREVTTRSEAAKESKPSQTAMPRRSGIRKNSERLKTSVETLASSATKIHSLSAPVVDGATVWIAATNDPDASAARWEVRSLIDGALIRESSAAPTASSDSGLEIDGRHLIRRGSDDAPPVVWADCSLLGDIQTRPLVHNHRVYVGVGRRLVCLGEADRP